MNTELYYDVILLPKASEPHISLEKKCKTMALFIYYTNKVVKYRTSNKFTISKDGSKCVKSDDCLRQRAEHLYDGSGIRVCQPNVYLKLGIVQHYILKTKLMFLSEILFCESLDLQ